MGIGEYAGAVELSISAVRFYADRGLLPPATTDPTTGYRFYTDDQVSRGSMIRDLRLIEMSLNEIARVLDLVPAERDIAVEHHLEQLENRLSDARTVARALRASSRAGAATATTLRSVDLAQAIVQVLPAAGSNPREPHHMSVLIEVKDNSLRCVATDSHRLAVRDLVPNAVGRSFSTVVAAADIRPWPDALQAVGDITVDMADGAFFVAGDGLELCSPTIPVEFPDYENVLRTSANLATSITIDRHRLVSLIQSFDGEGTIVLAGSASELVMTRDETVHRIACEISGPDARVAINPRFAFDAIWHAVGAELIIEVDDALHPLTFRSADDGTYTSMLMPVKLH